MGVQSPKKAANSLYGGGANQATERPEAGAWRGPPGEQAIDENEVGKDSLLEEVDGLIIQGVHTTDRLPFNVLVTLLAFLNIITIGLEMDFGPGPAASMLDRSFWFVMEVMFAGWFCCEMVIRIYAKSDFFFHIWNVLDLCLVVANVIDLVVLKPLAIGGYIRFFTVMRALRGVKLVRLVRHYPSLRELWLLVGGLAQSVKALGWVSLIVLLVIYVCSIVVTTEIGHNVDAYGTGPSYDGTVWPYEKYFGTVFRSMFTLFQIMTLDGWCDDIVRHVVYRRPFMGVFFVIFLFFTAFGFMNIVIGIIVENTLAAAQVSDERIADQVGVSRKQAVERLHQILSKSDTHRTGEISIDELQAAYQSRIVKEQFKKIGLSLVEVKEIFKLLDYEQRGRVELKRFADACRELVGGSKRRDLAQVEVTVGALAQHLERLDTQFNTIESEISDLTKMAHQFMHSTVRVLTGFDGSVSVPEKPEKTRPARGGSQPPPARRALEN